ncbi:acyl-[acyl-carrier-protein] thioesterase [Alloiococcus sp. CFN-8]|uniref:acyl-[acyl-carrier-protein] thioesterase n=1 Tax=Alloiococcus sp. CFN-8 TaxID=3416081 RepID=UPI003CF7C699
MNENIYTKEYEVRYYEIDSKKRLLKSSLLNYFTDISTIHSIERGVGIDYLEKKRLGWVISKYDIEFFNEGYYMDKLKVSTEAYGFKKYFAYRTFKAEGEDSSVIARGNALFMLIDMEKRRMLRIGEDMMMAYGVSPEEADRQLDFERIEGLEKIAYQVDFQVRYTDIDTNGHVNNVKYLDWLIEAIPLEIINEKSLRRIKMDYIKECFYGETITSRVQLIEEEESKEIKVIHSIINEAGKEVTRGETYWI